MIDIFDIISEQKDVRIHIKGKVYESGLLYDIEYINELINLIIENENDVAFKKFNIEEEKDGPGRLTANRFGMYGGYEYHSYKAIEFDIDVYITNKLNKKIDNHLQDFIDFFTVGAIVYPNNIISGQRDLSLSFDSHEEYLSTWPNYDIDGDTIFAAEFRPTDFSGMFRNCNNLDLSRLD